MKGLENMKLTYLFNCTECGQQTKYQNKCKTETGCLRRHYCDKCKNTYVVEYNENDNPIRIKKAYKTIIII